MLKKIFFAFARYSGLNFLYGYFSDEKVFIVGYHSVFSEKNRDILKASEYAKVSLSAEMFEKQIKFMVDHGHNFLRFCDLPDLKNKNVKKPTIIYFDDGFGDNVLNVLPILKKYKIPATFFIVPEYANSGNPIYMNWDDIRGLKNEGMEIGSHTYSHAVLTQVSEQVLKDELLSSKNKIEKEIKFPVEIFSHPKGRVNENVIVAVKAAGYKYAITAKYGVNDSEFILSNPYMLKKVAPRVYESLADFTVRLYSYNMFR